MNQTYISDPQRRWQVENVFTKHPPGHTCRFIGADRSAFQLSYAGAIV